LLDADVIREDIANINRETAVNDAIKILRSKSLEERKKNVSNLLELQNIIKEQAELAKLHITL